MMNKATTVAEIYKVIDGGRPLEIDEIDSFYYDADNVRDDMPARGKLAISIRNQTEAERSGHFLFVGTTGSGKSTELKHLQKDLQQDFAIISYSIFSELNPQSINYVELFIVQMEKLFAYVKDMDVDVDPALLKRIVDWTNTTEFKQVKGKHISADLSVGVNAKFGIPYLQELFFKLKGVAKASQSFKETITKHIEPKLSDLIEFGNELVNDIRMKIKAQGKKDIIILVDDIEKIDLKLAQDLFYDHAQQLVELNMTIVYVFPVWLYYHIRFNTIKNYFAGVVELPMIKVSDKAGNPYQPGIEALKKMVCKRMESDLFETPDLLINMIKKSGGVIRDLFNMVKDAAFYAEVKGTGKMNQDGYEYAYRLAYRQYDNTIADNIGKDGKITYHASDYYDALVALANNPDKTVENSEVMMHLRQNLCMLTYNGEGWNDVHPIMMDILHDRRKL